MQDTVNQAHGAVPRALANIVGVASALVVRAGPVDLPACAPGRSPVRARGWHWHRQLHWIPGTMSAMSTTTIRTLACALPVTLG